MRQTFRLASSDDLADSHSPPRSTHSLQVGCPIVAVVRRQRRRVVYPLHRVGLVLSLALAGGTQDVVRACLALVVNAVHGPFTAVARDALVK